MRGARCGWARSMQEASERAIGRMDAGVSDALRLLGAPLSVLASTGGQAEKVRVAMPLEEVLLDPRPRGWAPPGGAPWGLTDGRPFKHK